MTGTDKPAENHLFGWLRFGSPNLVAPEEPDTASGALVLTLRADPFAKLGLAALGALLVIDVLALVLSDLAYLGTAATLLRPLLAVLLVKAGLGRIIHVDERRFWNAVAIAFALSLAASTLDVFAPPSGSSSGVIADLLFAASFLALVVAVERPMKRRRGLHSADYGVTLTWSGGTVFVLGILLYFIILPRALGVEENDTRIARYYMFLVFDLYVAGKLMYLGRIIESLRWKMLYSLLMLMMLGVFARDFIDCLKIAGVLNAPISWLAALTSTLPYLFLLLAARLRHHPFPSEESLFDSVNRKDPLPWPRERLVIYALTFPVMHFLFQAAGFHPDSHPVRESLVLTWLLIFGAMALFQQRLFEKKFRLLWMERMRAEESLHRGRETLRLTEERKSAEKALLKSEEKFSKAFRSIPDAMLISTLADGCILEVNESFQRQFEYTRSEVLGKTGVELELWVEPEDRAMMTRLLRERGAVRNLEFQLTRKSGERRLTLLSGEVIDLEGESCFLMVLRDITAKRELEEKLRRARAFESIGTLTSAIAHDLNHVLIPIKTTVKTLRQAYPGKQYGSLLRNLEEYSQNGLDMVQQILAFCGRAGERLAFRPKHLVSDLENSARRSFPESVAIKTSIPDEAWSVEGDAGQLREVLRHLLKNAREAMDDAANECGSGSLRLEMENVWMDSFYAQRHPEAREGPYVVITLRDTGRGIAQEHLEKIFDPRFTTKKEPEESGLGLAISETIVKGHGGFMTVYSELGKGTSFQVFLPARIDAPEDKAAPELPVGDGECVLVVDDDVSICDIIRETLEAFGYRVIAAHNGAEALERYREHRSEIDLAVIDMIMPFMDGESTIRELKALDPELIVIAVSGLASREEARRSDHVRIFLEKPYTAEKLLTSLRDALSTTS